MLTEGDRWLLQVNFSTFAHLMACGKGTGCYMADSSRNGYKTYWTGKKRVQEFCEDQQQGNVILISSNIYSIFVTYTFYCWSAHLGLTLNWSSRQRTPPVDFICYHPYCPGGWIFTRNVSIICGEWFMDVIGCCVHLMNMTFNGRWRLFIHTCQAIRIKNFQLPQYIFR